MEENKLKNGFLGKVGRIVMVIAVVASLGLSITSFTTAFGPNSASAMTQTQKDLNDLISKITKDKKLTDNQKAMLIEVFRNFSTDCIVSMDDARLVIDRLLDSGLLTDYDKNLLTTLKSKIDSGEITNLPLVKAVLSNVLLRIKGYIVGEKSETFMGLESLADQIKLDASLTEEQKGKYNDIIYALLDEDIILNNLDKPEDIEGLISTMLDNGLITDPATENALTGALDELKNGKTGNIEFIRELLKYAFRQMQGDESLNNDGKALVNELISAYTNINDNNVEFDNVGDGDKFLGLLLGSGLVKDAKTIRFGRSVHEKENPELGEVNEAVNMALNDIRDNLLSEKISILTGVNVPDGVNVDEYYKQLVARYTSSQFNYLETLALANRKELDNLLLELDNNMILTDEQRERMMSILSDYSKGGDSITEATAKELQDAIDKNGNMDSRTKAELLNIINSVSGDNKEGVNDLREALEEKIEELEDTDSALADDLKKALANLNAADQANYDKLKAELKKLSDDEEDDVDDLSLSIASVKEQLIKSNEAGSLSDAALKNEIAALDRKTASAIQNLTDKTESDIQDLSDKTDADIQDLRDEKDTDIQNLRDEKNTDIQNLKNETDTNIQNLRNEKDADIQDLRDETDAKIANLRNETNTALALLRSDLNAVEESVVDTNARLTDTTTRLVTRDEDMKTAIDASLMTSFGNLGSNLSEFITNTQNNFLNLQNENATNYNNMKANLGMQMNYTLDTTDPSNPVLTFTPYGNGFENYDSGTFTETDDNTATAYESPVYTAP